MIHISADDNLDRIENQQRDVACFMICRSLLSTKHERKSLEFCFFFFLFEEKNHFSYSLADLDIYIQQMQVVCK